MKIRAKIKPNSKKGPLVVKNRDEMGEFFEIFVREPAVEGKANAGVVKILSEYFGVAKTRISLEKAAKASLKFSKSTKIRLDTQKILC